MIFKSRLNNIQHDYITGQYVVSFQIPKASIEAVNSLKDVDVEVEVKKYSPKRTQQANRLLWKCLGLFADAIGVDNWSAYLYMLKRYGQFTTIEIKKEAYETFKQYYRACDVVGETEETYIVNCYFGSHEYSVKDFSRLINGVIDEMNELGVHLPMTQEELERSLALWGKSHP